MPVYETRCPTLSLPGVVLLPVSSPSWDGRGWDGEDRCEGKGREGEGRCGGRELDGDEICRGREWVGDGR